MAREPNEIVQLKLRFRESLRERLEKAASEEGESLNSTIVARLERSLREDAEFGIGTQAEVLRAIIGIMGATTRTFGRPWYEDPDGAQTVRSVVSYLLSLIRPEGDIYSPYGLEAKPEVQAALREYEKAREEITQQHYAHATRYTELHLKNEQGNLSPDELAEMDDLRAQVLPEIPEPDLAPEDLQIWREEKALIERIEQAKQRAISYTMPFNDRFFG